MSNSNEADAVGTSQLVISQHPLEHAISQHPLELVISQHPLVLVISQHPLELGLACGSWVKEEGGARSRAGPARLCSSSEPTQRAAHAAHSSGFSIFEGGAKIDGRDCTKECTDGRDCTKECTDGRDCTKECTDGAEQCRTGRWRRYSVAVERSTGDVVMVGRFRDTHFAFGGVTLVNTWFALIGSEQEEEIHRNRTTDVFVMKVSREGTVRWGLGWGVASDHAYGVAVTENGSVYVAGGFMSERFRIAEDLVLRTKFSETCGEEHCTEDRDDEDAFLAKVSSGGSVLWGIEGGGLGTDLARTVAVGLGEDPDVFVGGTFTDHATFGGDPLVGAGHTDAFLTKVSALGTMVWTHQAGGVEYDYGRGVAVDIEGDVYLTGHYSRTGTFGLGHVLTSSSLDHDDSFIMKVRSSGTLDFAISGGGAGMDRGTAAAAANHAAGGHSLFIVGWFNSSEGMSTLEDTMAAIASTVDAEDVDIGFIHQGADQGTMRVSAQVTLNTTEEADAYLASVRSIGVTTFTEDVYWDPPLGPPVLIDARIRDPVIAYEPPSPPEESTSSDDESRSFEYVVIGGLLVIGLGGFAGGGACYLYHRAHGTSMDVILHPSVGPKGKVFPQDSGLDLDITAAPEAMEIVKKEEGSS
ncbi:hypothetical protein CYMTET_51687 [Cymbomonas tetramitiformis]|uniref:Uncharacterized protein n=1 Tax=Cymbomonas tetramitiformis TaxID=36881 RepID=A0AAE0BKS3_9CHLO|nr:hypothetical protein CYMTET_51687 [Cymbomonas tetramitiformis]